jgi:hypothetical protein
MVSARKKGLDKVPKKRGPRSKVIRSEFFGRSEHFRAIFGRQGVWEALYPRLRDAQTEADVVKTFEDLKYVIGDAHYFIGLQGLILKVIHDRRFPKDQRNAQVEFFADSLVGRGLVGPARSRDICREERAKATNAKHILRYEFYVECSCGYKGPARNDRCADCGAPIVFVPWRQF